MAGLELKQSNFKVIDIAKKFDYHYPDAFTRAFQQIHSATPSCARKLNQQLRAFPRLSSQLIIRSINKEKIIQFHNSSKESNPCGVVHVTSNHQDIDEGAFTFTQYIGYVSEGNKTEGLSSLDSSADTWAVFELAMSFFNFSSMVLL